ncbi:hypothetical protein [Croceitalea rosinachiae]|uniref:Uncharacterized protein n=1 Tax=Croceitalea rosinachiae TaxID=3075596 RepID=A0ABU3AFZ8_9FLAO|nr:hypothetical protein [Croceitalea sp. F388]MDT0608038.1 hypothetical protein [Croceitalea sp. F388]
MGILEKNIQNIPGYKIEDSHFRIGSKIHVSHFYYAKRFFQNGFFSSRMAFLLAQEICETINDDLLIRIKEKGLTILGYEMYSEVLLSMLKGMLRKLWNLDEEKLNHNLYEDAPELRLIKKAEIHPYVIIVVPIATTFGTAPKIENQLRIEASVNYEVLSPLFNVLYISDGPVVDTMSDLENKFGWEEKRTSDRLIRMKSIYDYNGEGRNQRYLLSIPSQWHDIKSCELCHPGDREELSLEKPLYDTDKTNVTPAVIFGFPRGRKFDEDEVGRIYRLSEDMIYYGYHKRNHAHFLSSIDSERFLQANRKEVGIWLDDLKDQLVNNKGYRETDKVILISPSHYSNAKFIGMVNETLFNGSGNILHYDSTNEYIQNFDLIYGKEIKEAQWVFFVDDSLKSGSAFYKIFRFIESVMPRGTTNYPVSGVIVLLNKSQPHVWNHINNLLPKEFDFAKNTGTRKTIFSGFANLHFYNAIKDYEHPPILLEKERYKELRKSSSLDVLKVRFAEKVNKIRAVELSKEDKERDKKKKKKQRLLVIASHKIVEYFTRVDEPRLTGFYDFMNHLIENQENQIEDYLVPSDIDSIEDNFAKSFLKALTQLPFNQYKPLRDVVFRWTLELLDNLIYEITATLRNNVLTYEQFDTLRFLMRRACLLNSNALISSKFLKFVARLYGKHGIPDMVGKTENFLETLGEEEKPEKLEEINKLKTFFIYYVVQIKELLHKNEYRSLVLETNLLEIKDNSNPFIKQLTRILIEENVALMQAYKYLGQLERWKNVYKEDNPEGDYYSNKKIEEILKMEIVKNHPRFVALDEYFQVTEQQPIVRNETLKNFLWLENFFEHEHKKPFQLIEKTEHIFSKFFDMFKVNNIEKIGAFFVILNNKELSSAGLSPLSEKSEPFVAFNKDCDGFRGIDINNLLKDGNLFLDSFLSGNPGTDENGRLNIGFYRKTIAELELAEKGWENLYKTPFTSEDILLEQGLLPRITGRKYNRLLLIQIARPKDSEDVKLRSQGLLGFYYSLNGEDLLSPYLVQYLLLLRNALSAFISRHHENDEFRDWQIANIKQRTSLLTGHGREMLMRLAPGKPEFRGIVETLLLVQRFVIDKKDETKIVGENNSQVSKIFHEHFSARVINDGFRINKAFIENDLKELADSIFMLDKIENHEEVDSAVITEENQLDKLNFEFSGDILRMICFELFLNAKKNRWIFLENEEVKDFDGKIYTKNYLGIEANMNGKNLELIIRNTGPCLGFKGNELNNGTPLKDDQSSSGIELIKALLKEFKLGELWFLETSTLNNDYFGIISVMLELKPMKPGKLL